ncbi:LOW QUALITY PROTEIN: 6,7,8-trihydroxycoumarin synthase-like [Actinidia eriantha]|uniref:LOW QUALITY PROTEIN: 6,7,8-trihydroxycoumarin synthase-like n=1 Tax=Actinidia eriantha TaxID=165200 RepID=UPI0025841DCB|nr:LOW QUALITY PROTEIN: 6,7,8-trihydroxycoumarin synthase-like [Actinidia eriantha]
MKLLSFLFVLPLFLLFLLRKHRKNGKAMNPPGPPGLPFVGNLHQLDFSTLHSHLRQLSKTYGPLMTIRLGFVPTLVVSSAKMAEEVMKTHDLIFCSRPTLLGQQKLSYNQLDVAFSPYNDYWREMRKICVLHLFSSKRVQSFRHIREDEVSRMIEKISNLAAASKLANLDEIVMSLTSIIICRVAFGKRYDEGGYESHRFHSLLTEYQAMIVQFFISDYFPLLGWVDTVTGMRSRLEKSFKDFDLFYEELIDEHLHPKRPKSSQQDILDILLQLKEDPSTSVDLSMDHVKALLMDIFTAGTDTGAASIVWAMTALMKNPTVLKKVQEEVRTLVGKKGKVDEDDIHSLPYLKAMIKETMRLYPPAPLLVPHKTTQRCVIDGYEIEPQTVVYINAWAIARDPESWENPEEFLPERFLGSDIDFRGQNFELIPFGAGRRGCPGINLGVATVELALANLLYSFDWELPEGMKKEDVDTEVLPGLTMHRKNALCLVAKKY